MSRGYADPDSQSSAAESVEGIGVSLWKFDSTVVNPSVIAPIDVNETYSAHKRYIRELETERNIPQSPTRLE